MGNAVLVALVSAVVALASGKATLAGYLRCLHKREEKRHQKKAGAKSDGGFRFRRKIEVPVDNWH